jgi:NAD-dependent deacetylase
MLERAIEITEKADVFLVIGTSLLVYPAASLVQYTTLQSEKWIIDPKIPQHLPSYFNTIEKPATLGMREYIQKLNHI